jgi:uncharacterized protein (TIGR02145 family)
METDTFTNPDSGYTFKTVKIGNQWWMAENMQSVYNVSPDDMIHYGWQNDDYMTDEQRMDAADHDAKYGGLYTWQGAKDVCPTEFGWHLPTEAEWTELINYVSNNGHSGSESSALSSKTDWKDVNGTDDFGFGVLPAGAYKSWGSFGGLGETGHLWGIDVQGRKIEVEVCVKSNFVVVGGVDGPSEPRYSVRCIKRD